MSSAMRSSPASSKQGRRRSRRRKRLVIVAFAVGLTIYFNREVSIENISIFIDTIFGAD